MDEHRNRHSSERHFICEWKGCGKRFKAKTDLTKHVKTHNKSKGNVEKASEKPFLSPKVFGFRSNLRSKRLSAKKANEKIKEQIEETTGFESEVRDERHESKTDKKSHIFRQIFVKKESDPSKTIDKDFACDYSGCDFQTNHKTSLDEHRVRHSNERNFVCTRIGCEKRFKVKKDLSDHMKTHEIKKYCCPRKGCYRRFMKPSKLRQHLLTHTTRID